MAKSNKEIKEMLQKIIKEEYNDYLLEAGITGWLIDKVADGFKWYANKKADYQYDALLNSKDFRSLAKSYGYNDEEAFIKRAKQLIAKDPKKFADLLVYDVRKGAFGKYFK